MLPVAWCSSVPSTNTERVFLPKLCISVRQQDELLPVSSCCTSHCFKPPDLHHQQKTSIAQNSCQYERPQSVCQWNSWKVFPTDPRTRAPAFTVPTTIHCCSQQPPSRRLNLWKCQWIFPGIILKKKAQEIDPEHIITPSELEEMQLKWWGMGPCVCVKAHGGITAQ